RYFRRVKAGDLAILVGGRTGRDGIHGVTFASAELHDESQDVSATAVQIGDPIEEEKIKRAILRVRDEELCSGITDLGGGGLSSALGEMCHSYKLGAVVDLEKVPLKYPDMRPWEIWTSESQERMLVMVPKGNLERVSEIFASEEVEAVAVGRFTADGKLVIRFNGDETAELDVGFLFDGMPRVERRAKWVKPEYREPDFPLKDDWTEALLLVLSMPNVASKEAVIRTYDHEVKGATVIKPLQGAEGDSPGDASVLKPLPDSWRGVVVSNGVNTYGRIDPYWMGASAIDEAIRNNVAVGGRRIAILDNFCWGNPEKEDRLGGLVRAARACYDFGRAYLTPFISGKDSLYNESHLGPVLPTLLISAVGVMPDIRRAVTMDIKKAGSYVYLLGESRDELGGSQYYKSEGYVGNQVPTVEAEEAKMTMSSLLAAMDKGLVRACHDLSDGGLGVAAAEMAFAGAIGMELSIPSVPLAVKMRPDHVIFSESNSRFLVEVGAEDADGFEACMQGKYARIGRTLEEEVLLMRDEKDKAIVSGGLAELKAAWRGGLDEGG
ncbi:MAG: AIR synthase-related protein, partial [Candidatus Hydrothermarchaeaceae archaeon]